MKYIFAIEDKNSKAKSIIKMLHELKQDYDFIESTEEPFYDDSHPVIKQELLYRQQETLKAKNGKTWNQLQKEL